MSSNRQIVKLTTLHDETDDQFLQFTPAERMSMVWPLTIDAWSITEDFNAKSRLQRHITKLYQPRR